MDEARTHPLTLRFASDALEAAFRDDVFKRSLWHTRFAILLGGLLYAAYGLLDRWFVPDARPAFLLLRATICTVALVLLAITFTPLFRRWSQQLLAGGALLAGLGISAMVALVDESRGYFYHDHLMLVVVYAFVLLRLRFVLASGVCWTAVGVYEAVVLAEQPIPMPLFVNGTLALVSTCVLCMSAGYALEYLARRAYWTTHVIDEQRRQNERLVQTQSRFFANLSHEFRTPLTLIVGPIENLLAAGPGALEPPVREQLAVMHHNARRLLRLINQLLDLSQLEAGCLPVRARPGDLVRLSRGVVHSFASYAERKQVALQFDAEPAAIHLAFDPDHVEKILSNLLSNAFKFTAEKGKIRVSLSEEHAAACVVLCVQDTGTGIPREELPYLFDRFHRGGRTVRRPGEGTGIGLALVKELVALHGGTIDVASTPGFGTTVTVRLSMRTPAAEPSPEAPAAAEAAGPELTEVLAVAAPAALIPAPPASRERLTLLIVDDVDDFRHYLRGALEPVYRVVEACDGQEALAKARETVPDLIIADVMMPRMDGYAFCRSLREDPVLNHVPVILLTARVSGESKVEGLETGADDYLSKPFNAKELHARVRNLIALRRTLRRRLARELGAPVPGGEVPSAEEAFLVRAREVVEQALAEPTFDVEAFAEGMGMSSRQLQRKLRALTGQSPNAFIRLVRLQRSAHLLEKGAGTVSEIAYAVGFNHPTYFMKRFREMYGRSPSEYGAEKAGGHA